MKSAVLFRLVTVLLCSSNAFAFFQNMGGAKVATAKSPQADEAIQIFNAKFPFGRDPLKPNNFVSFGMPANFEATRKNSGIRLTDISEQQARATFNELAKLYGSDAALEMTKAKPVILAFQKNDFAPSLKAYIEIFGDEEAKAMVTRNPGLLALTPEEAARASDSTMQASYLIGATAPYGDIILPTLLALLLVPAAEQLSGIPIRATLASSLGL